MVRCVVISIRLGEHVARFLRQKPQAGGELVDTIIARIDDSKTVKLTKNQVMVILGALEVPETGNFWQKRSIAVNQYYIIGDDCRPASVALDRGIRRIVDKATMKCLAGLYAWETPF